MRFAAPHFFWLLLVVVPLLAVFLWWAWRVKQRLIGQFVQSRLLANLTVGVSQPRQKLRLVLMVVAVALLFVALMRPQWGFSWEEAKQQGLDIVVAIDTSRSMLAEDVAPNRISRAKLAALDLMQLAKSDRLGLVSFAGTAFLQAPLTLDEEAFRQNVNALEVGIIPEGGTDLASAIETAQTAFEKSNDNHKVLVLITDGEDHESDAAALEAAEKAAKAGMKIFTIGVGTAEGELLRTRDEQGNASFIKDEDNNAVKSHLNETLLQKIATAANGFYLPLRGTDPIKTLYARGLAPLPKSDSTTKLTRVYRERFHWPLLLAIVCLGFEMLLPEHKAVRRSKNEESSAAAKTLVALCLLLMPFIASASPSSAMRQYESGKFTDSFAEYDRLSEQKTNDYRLHYNAGTAAYQANQFEAAEKHLNAAINSPEIVSDLATQERAYFNLGNTQFKMGSDKWPQAVTNFDRAVKLDPKDTNAVSNLAFVRKKLEELKKQQQQQQNGQDKDQKDQKDQQQKDQQAKKDQKDQQNSQQKNDQNKQQQNQSSDQEKQKQQQQQQSQAQKDKDQKDQKQAAAQKKEDKEKGDEQSVAAGQLTRQQAKQLLDAQQEDEKALIFTPENAQTNTVSRSRKNW